MKSAIAIVTARGGSKRILRKNIKNFLGSPIIKYSIEAAILSGCFDEVMVSTDDAEIAAIAESFGANVPFFRSKVNSDDFSTTSDVLVEVVNEYKNKGREFDYICCIYPTAPFITAEKLNAGMRIITTSEAESVFPVVQFSYPVERRLKISDGVTYMVNPENYYLRSQDISPSYHDAGQFYWLKTDSFLLQRKLFAEKTIPIITSALEVQDIDSEDDWKLAELKFTLLNQNR